MSKQRNTPSSNKPEAKPSPESDRQSYYAIALVFSMVGIAMIIAESTRTTGIPFLVLGITFFAIAQNEPRSNRKK